MEPVHDRQVVRVAAITNWWLVAQRFGLHLSVRATA
jgi:hypothetical protein